MEKRERWKRENSLVSHLRHFERPLEMSAMPPIATKNGEPLKRVLRPGFETRG